MGDCPIARSAGVSRQGEKLIPARLLPSAGHRRQRSLSRVTRRWNRRRFAPRLIAKQLARQTEAMAEHLYKYRTLDGPGRLYAERLLVHNEVYLSSPRSFNDPF